MMLSDTGLVMVLAFASGVMTLFFLLFLAGWAAMTRRFKAALGTILWWLIFGFIFLIAIFLQEFWLSINPDYKGTPQNAVILFGSAALIFEAVITLLLIFLTAGGNGSCFCAVSLFIWIGMIIVTGIFLGFEAPLYFPYYLLILVGIILGYYLLKAIFSKKIS